MARIEERSGAWSYRIVDEHGSRVRRTFDTHREAKAALIEDLARVQAACSRPTAEGPKEPGGLPMTFGELADKYLAYVENGTDIRSKKDPKSIVNAHLRPFFGSLRLEQITTGGIDTFKEQQLKAGLAPLTVGHHLMAISGIFKFGREHEYTTRKPKIRRPRCPKRTKEDR